MINTASLQFLYELSQNNNKDWFDKNKARYEADLKKPWEATVAAIIERIKAFEPDLQSTAKESIPRIYRDTRFSTNKSPYKTNVAAIINPGGKKAGHRGGGRRDLCAGRDGACGLCQRP